MEWSDPTVQAALIQASSVVIASIVAALIGRQVVNTKKLQEKHVMALQDIAFLLAVEEEHCDRNQKSIGRSMKLNIRDIARQRGFLWTGKFTPGRAGIQQ